MKSHSVTLWKYTARTLGSIVVLCGSFAITLFSTILSPNREVLANTDCANATVPQPQCQALVDIFTNMGGTSRNPVYTQGTGNTNLGGPSSGWLANDDPCSWHGVTCDTSSPRNVIGLNFGGTKFNYCFNYSTYIAGITGSFPSNFSAFTSLQTLDIQNNAGINQTSLQTLLLPSTLINYCASNVGLSTLSPTQFQGLSNLQNLYLNQNQITGLNSNQFSGLSSMQILSLSYNQISSLSPTQLAGLTNLRELYLNNLKKSSPYFTGAIPATYSGMNFTTNPGDTRFLYVRQIGGSTPNTICGQQPTWITNAWNQYFSGNRGNTDLDDLNWFGGTGQRVKFCPGGASCNPTASPSDCASGLSCLENGNPSGIFTCQSGSNPPPPPPPSFSCSNVTAIPQPQCQALVDIYNQMGGTGRSSRYQSGKTDNTYEGGPSSGWVTNNDPCSRNGVVCDDNVPQKNIIGLHFAGHSNECFRCSSSAKAGLQGLFPQSFSNLTFLEALNIGGNNGIDHDSIRGLILPNTIKYYGLRGLGLTHLHPTQFEGLNNLLGLSISGNPLTGGIVAHQFQNLNQLKYLYMHQTQLMLLSPIQFQDLSHLEVLSFGGLIHGAIPASYSGMDLTTSGGKLLHVINFGGNSNIICGQKPTWIQTARDQNFSGNIHYTDLDELSRFSGSKQVNLCPIGASCNTTADCASGLTCSGNGNPSGFFTCQGTGTNQYPTVTLTIPNNVAPLVAPATIQMEAIATDPDGTIQNVQFRNGSTTLHTDSSSPYTYNWTNVPAGTYNITAVATDNSGATTTSTAITITVQNSNTTCTAGSYRNGTTCTTCPANNYCPTGATTPTACPSGTTSPSGSRSMSHCINPNNPDTDGDSVPDNQEQTTPNNGDANFDSVQDATQTTVRTYQTPTNGIQATISLTGLSTCTGTIITQIQTEAQVANDTQYTYPFGLNRIIVPCSQATVRVYYHGVSNINTLLYRKYMNNTYQNFPVTFGTQSGIPYLQFPLVDGGAGDSDGTANGTINDPGGLAVMQFSQPSGGGGGGGGRSTSVNCGNGRIDSGESCDDGNIKGGDGCNARCSKETGMLSGGSTDLTTPKATMIKMLQETLDTLEMACEHENDDRTKKIKNMRDMSREDRFDAEATLTNYCITKGYKNKRQKNASMGIGEAIKIVTKIATLDEGIKFREGEKPDRSLPYKDIKSNARYATYVNVAYDKGILDGLTDSHRNKKELKAFTPISASQLILILENAGGIKQTISNSNDDQALDDVLGLILPAKQNLSPLKGKTISRAQAAKYIVNAFPEYFENYEYLVGNNAVYLGNILAGISKKNEAEQRSYIIDKINTLKNVNEATYGEKYKIDTEVIITFLEKVVN